MDSQSTPEISPQLMSRLKRIKVLLMDVDGVLTDGRLFYFPDASGKPDQVKGFNSQDGVGFHMLNAAGIKSGVISGRESSHSRKSSDTEYKLRVSRVSRERCIE